MHRSPWELEAHVRHQTALLATERRICSPPDGGSRQPTNPLARLRHGAGLGLIRVGEALTGHESVSVLSTAATRRATSARPGS